MRGIKGKEEKKRKGRTIEEEREEWGNKGNEK